MEHLEIAGRKMPALGFGTWQLDGSACVAAVEGALALGYRHIDTAQIYHNEGEVGRALQHSGVAREDIFLTTKLWTTNLTPERVAASLEESLDKLRTEYVDLLLIHWPNAGVPLGATLGAMQKAQEAGKARAIGVSNFPVACMREAVENYGAPIAVNQVEYHVLLSQAKVRAYAARHGVQIVAYSPLARGTLLRHPTLEAIGKPYGKTPAQVALRWLLDQAGVAAIPKAASLANAKANIDIFDFALSEADNAALAALTGEGRVINPAFAPTWDSV